MTKPAPHARRIFAAAVDLVIVMVATNLTFVPFVFLLDLEDFNESFAQKLAAGEIPLAAVFAFLLVLLVMTALMHVYFIAFEEKRGATPGKMMVNLRVLSADGSPVTRRQAVVRELVRWYLDVPLLPLALVALAVTRKHQRFGDMIAKTEVVQVLR